jgi:hypothetical protein
MHVDAHKDSKIRIIRAIKDHRTRRNHNIALTVCVDIFLHSIWISEAGQLTQQSTHAAAADGNQRPIPGGGGRFLAKPADSRRRRPIPAADDRFLVADDFWQPIPGGGRFLAIDSLWGSGDRLLEMRRLGRTGDGDGPEGEKTDRRGCLRNLGRGRENGGDRWRSEKP